MVIVRVLTVTLPLKVFAAVSVNVPVPDLVKLAVSPMALPPIV